VTVPCIHYRGGDDVVHCAISQAVKVVVTNDQWADDDPADAQNADGWPRILSRLMTPLETGKTFRPH
jgi:hypothetical protein